MKETAKHLQLPPASASEKEREEELVKGTPYTYRFRVPEEGTLKINDLIRGEVISPVSWNLDTLGDFVIMRSKGQPVYNLCVTVDDATMHISHVIRGAFTKHLATSTHLQFLQRLSLLSLLLLARRIEARESRDISLPVLFILMR